VCLSMRTHLSNQSQFCKSTCQYMLVHVNLHEVDCELDGNREAQRTLRLLVVVSLSGSSPRLITGVYIFSSTFVSIGIDVAE